MYQFHYNSLWAYLPPCFAVCIRRHKNEYAMLRTAHPFLWVNLSILSNFNNIFLHSLRWWRYTQVLSRALDDMQSVANALLALYGVRGTTQGDIDQANRTRAFSLSEGGGWAEFVVKNLNHEALGQLEGEVAPQHLATVHDSKSVR